MTARPFPGPMRRVRGRRGTALVEFVMTIPVLAVLIGLTFFFGWSMNNQQQVKVSNRYAPWREVHNVEDRVRDANWARLNPDVTNDYLREIFFCPKASVGLSGGSGPEDVLEKLMSSVGTGSARAEALAHALILEDPGHWPHGNSASVTADVPATVPLWRNLGLNGPIRAGYVRDGLSWRLEEEKQPWSTLRDQFLTEPDMVFSTIPAPGDRWGRTMRTLYLAEWHRLSGR